jgi:hypothetical protein
MNDIISFAARPNVARCGAAARDCEKIDAEMCTATFLWPQSGDGDHQRDDFRPIGMPTAAAPARFNQCTAVP